MRKNSMGDVDTSAPPSHEHRCNQPGRTASLCILRGIRQPVTTLLVEADAEADFKPLRPSDLAVAKPLLVFPFDPKTSTPKNESRLNKIVVVRLPEDQMTPETRARSASGVVAYSSICTHQGCDVKTWMSKESVLACYCHASKFNLFDGAKVVSGPASSPLPAIPLTLVGEFLAIAAPPVKPGE
jgi:rieske iron-sulfur protein